MIGALRKTVPALALVTALLLAPGAAAGWSPGPERFEVGVDRSVPVEMKDGAILRADVYYPADPETGDRADGSFPVVLNMTPYGKRGLAFIGSAALGGEGEDASGLARTMPELVARGYINVIVDIRGTGRSTGTFKLLDPQQGRDGAEVIDWASKLPGSSGKVGLYGPSYMAIIQYLTAQHLERGSPLRAMLPVVVPYRPYDELATGGGMPAGEADIPLFTVFVALPLAMPIIDNGWEDPSASLAALARNVPSLTEGLAPLGAEFFSDGDVLYDQRFWQQRSPGATLRKVTKLRVPTLSIGGWRDVFQRGTLMNYAGHQNLAAGRPAHLPMGRDQRPSSRYQAIQGDWVHVNAGRGFPLAEVAQRWFDTWLKGKKGTGVRNVKRPLRLFDMTRKRWVETKRYPFGEAQPRNFFLGDGRLSQSPPEGSDGADTLVFTGVSSPCSGNTDQYGLGALTLALESAGLENPCVRDDRTLGLGPGALTYSTEPMSAPRTLAGPIGARIFATSTRPDVSLIATLEDVAPGGASRYLTSGYLLGSHRALDPERSWGAGDGDLIRPVHPYKRAALESVPVGEVTRFDVEIFPVLATLEPGHSLRLTLTSVDTPHITPVPHQMGNLLGGVYGIQRNAQFASRLTIPMASPARFKYECAICD